MKEYNIKKGFTIVETLVAVTILMIAIAGPLTVANKAYTAALDARNQTVAYNAAQYYLEYYNNYKDNAGWGAFHQLDQDIHVWWLDEVINVPLDVHVLWADVGADQILATVKVSWKYGSVTNEIQLQEILSNYTR